MQFYMHPWMVLCIFRGEIIYYGNAFHSTGPMWGESNGHQSPECSSIMQRDILHSLWSVEFYHTGYVHVNSWVSRLIFTAQVKDLHLANDKYFHSFHSSQTNCNPSIIELCKEMPNSVECINLFNKKTYTDLWMRAWVYEYEWHMFIEINPAAEIAHYI